MFHAINRNKQSYKADMKAIAEREKVYKLIKQADVIMHNFRPGVASKLGIDYDTITAINPSIVYAVV